MLKPLDLSNDAPWKQRYRAPIILWTQRALVAPARGLAASNRSGKYQLYAWDVASGELRQLTDKPEGLIFGALAPDGRYIYYLSDQGGNEIGHYVRVPYTGGEPSDLTPDLPPYSSFGFEQSRDAGTIAFMAASAEGFKVYCLSALGDEAPRQLYQSTKLFQGPVLNFNGTLAVIATTERSALQHFNLLAIDTQTGATVAELWDGPNTSIEPVVFAAVPGENRVLATTNRSGARRPLLWNPVTGERRDLELPDLVGEVVPLDWAGDGDRLLLCHFAQGRQQLYIYHLSNGALDKLNHPGGTFGFFASTGTYFASADEIFAQWQDSTHPSCLIALDATTGRQTRTVLSAGAVPAGRQWESVSFPSSDGQTIQGWLALPADRSQGPFPVILHTHGGPESVATEVFGPGSQAWLDHGFAFLTINYRGSTTFGRDFQEKIWGDLGNWEVEDMVAARDWLVNASLALPDSILLTGWSYGGYLTLLGLGKRPDLWAGGMGGIAIADWSIQYEDSAETLRGYQRALFGGTPEEQPERYARSSPITYAERVAAPVCIIQGRNDTRTPARPIEMYEVKLKALGKPVEVHWFEAGHTGAGVEQDIQNQETFMRFAYRVLG